ncbi:bursicon-like [Saccoglossus kowalevskii]|uniref:Bursicon n=1 Tax=Saccoglossus kowalevskii TaxID=10224 RepID=A0ABM0MA85_SACKO|nr:PREDICTED: bursicon-like [Saccoglossus kowalevskii]
MATYPPITSAECSSAFAHMIVTYPGCIPKRIPTMACRGSCPSYTEPHWSNVYQELVYKDFCTCCAPLHKRVGTVNLRCPGREGGPTMAMKVQAALDCQCRPCSNGYIRPLDEEEY